MNAARPTRDRTPLGRRIASITLSLAAIIGVLSLLVGALAFILGFRPLIFSTGSMDPAIPAGSLALVVPVQPDEIQPGDVVSAKRPVDRKLVTHRVVSIEHVGNQWLATMKGDGNSANDSTPYNVTTDALRVAWSAPGVGSAILFLQTPWVLIGIFSLLILIAIPTTRAVKGGGSREAEEPESQPQEQLVSRRQRRKALEATAHRRQRGPGRRRGSYIPLANDTRAQHEYV